jgi:hypothetical protein
MSVERIDCLSCTGHFCDECGGTGELWVPSSVARRLRELEEMVRDKRIILEVERKMGSAHQVGQRVRTTKESGGLTASEMKEFNERRWGVPGKVLEEREIQGVYIYRVRHDPAPEMPIYGWYTVSELEGI